MGNSAKRDARKFAAAELTKRALDLRLAGASYEQIADAKLGPGFNDKSNVRKHIQKAIDAVPLEHAATLKVLTMMRLDALRRGVWVRAKSGGLPELDRALKIIERECALMGLDAPKSVAQAIVAVDTSSDGPTPADAMRAVQEFFGKVTPDLPGDEK